MQKKLFRTEISKYKAEAKPYSVVSEIYSDLMKEVNYKRWAKYIYLITRDKINADSDVLELASGSCNLTSFLKFKYKKIICTDISKEMLRKSNYQHRVVCDMLKLPFKKKFDLIFSTFDSFNYILTKKKLLTLFKEVHNSLSQEGLFTFDVSLEKNSYIHQRDAKKSGRINNFSYTRKSIYDPKTKIHKNIFEIRDNAGKDFTEVHEQKIYDFNTYFILLDKAGFYVENCYKTFTLREGWAETDRVQFIVRKK